MPRSTRANKRLTRPFLLKPLKPSRGKSCDSSGANKSERKRLYPSSFSLGGGETSVASGVPISTVKKVDSGEQYKDLHFEQSDTSYFLEKLYQKPLNQL